MMMDYMSQLRALVQMRNQVESDSDNDDAASIFSIDPSARPLTFKVPGTQKYASATACRGALNQYALPLAVSS